MSLDKNFITLIDKKKGMGSWLFIGPDSQSLDECVKDFAAKLLELDDDRIAHHKHPDIHHFYPQGKSATHSLDIVGRVAEQAYLQPLEATYQMIVIHHAERLSTVSANALLKLVEEPPLFTLIVLLTTDPDSILPTLSSRCRRFILHQKNSMENLSDVFSLKLFTLDPIARMETFREIAAHIEKIREDAEKEMKNHLLLKDKDLPKLLKEQIEKELEGMTSLQVHHFIEETLRAIYFFFRDILLVQLKIDQDFLYYKNSRETVDAFAKRLSFFSLEAVEQRLRLVKTYTERGIPFHNALESAFIDFKI